MKSYREVTRLHGICSIAESRGIYGRRLAEPTAFLRMRQNLVSDRRYNDLENDYREISGTDAANEIQESFHNWRTRAARLCRSYLRTALPNAGGDGRPSETGLRTLALIRARPIPQLKSTFAFVHLV